MNVKLRKFIEVGNSSTSGSSNTRRAELSVAVYVGENGYVQNAGFVHQPIAVLEKRDLTGPVAIILHRTDGASVQSALNSAKSGIGTHFYVDKDGTVYQTASLHKHTWRSQESSATRDLNARISCSQATAGVAQFNV